MWLNSHELLPCLNAGHCAEIQILSLETVPDNLRDLIVDWCFLLRICNRDN